MTNVISSRFRPTATQGGPVGEPSATSSGIASEEANESLVRLLVQEWREGWRPGFAAILGCALGYTLWLVLSSFFVEALQKEFGWSRGDIAFANSAGIVTGFAAPLLGRIVDRLGAKTVVIAGLATSALCYILLALMNGSLTYYYAVYFLLTVAGMSTTGITYARIIVGTFTATRGTSLAMLRVGVALSHAVMPLLLFPVIARFGSAGGFFMFAAINGLIMLPVVLLCVPRNLSPVGPARELEAGDRPTRWQLLMRRPKIFVISLAAMLHTAPVMAIMTQLKPIGVSLGLEPAAAAGALSALGVAAIIGALVAGLFVDRVWAPAIAFLLCCLVPAGGCIMLATLGDGISGPSFYLAVILIGIGMGGESDVLSYMVARYFGVQDFATIAGIAALAVTVGIAAGAALIGRAYDVFGNYQVSLIAAAVSLTLAGAAYLMMGRYPKAGASGL
ncbi:MFS transporter [Sphingobium amiense]|uniref:MFS transporter n=1 Tax=Sphingobium amiense TaxID=135719 RepID=A0A494W605_9SPHN|nr:MFS transporter [Sphingobium amiense]BBD99681.1 MFS transporter [Sphingobium amiense]